MTSRSVSLTRFAIGCLLLHATFSIFSAFAFATFLSGPPPEWLQRADSQRALLIGWRFGPATTVVLGALAAILHATGKLGARRAATLFAVAFTVSLAAELAGSATGYPFGPYSYSSILGYRIAGLVPFNIPTSWFYMLYASLAICARIIVPIEPGASRRMIELHRWRWAIVAGLVLTAWDVSMDPAMVRTNHWMWHLDGAGDQSMLSRIFVSDRFYGMPLLNWLGWLLTGTLIARLMIAIVPPDLWRKSVAPSRFPVALYAVNGILPIVICVRYGMTWAAVLGTAAMLVPIVLAMRARPLTRIVP